MIEQKKFCANPLCRFHLNVEPQQQQMTIQTPEGLIESRRHLYPTASGERIYLCTCCANVFNLVKTHH